MKPFPVSAQYLSSVLAAREAAGGEDSDGDGEKENMEPEENQPGGKKTKVPPKRKRKPKTKKDKPATKSEWKYSAIRTEFIKDKRSQGASYHDAVESWDSSLEKAQLLASVSVSELMKRKFLASGSKTNPWKEILEGHDSAT